MRKIFSILLLFAFGLIVIKPIVPFAYFVYNYKYIKEELCENKNKPELHCDGKCFLKKEIKKQRSDKLPESIIHFSKTELFIPFPKNETEGCFLFETERLFYCIVYSLTKGFLKPVYNPPKYK